MNSIEPGGTPHPAPRPPSQAPSRPSTRATLPAATLAATLTTAAILSALPALATGAAAQATPEPGQTVALVTGSTSGLGRELALRLGARGDHVIVHGRSVERGAEVVDSINAAGPGSARFYRADLASFAEVRTFAETLLADYDRLDILINNAGFGSSPNERLLTEDGHEYRFQVNYLSTFLLTHMLMPRVLSSAPSRIVNVSSGAQTPIDFDDVMIENNFSGRRAYAQSKLAQVMFTHDLAEELEGTGVVVGSLHPATYMPTGMVLRLGATPRATIAEGADAVMQVVDSDDFDSGQYFNGLRPARANAQAYDEEARARLEALSRELTGIGGPPADPADVESIDAIMEAVYDVISGDAGVARDWDRFRSLFAPGATLSPVGRSPAGAYGRRVMTPEEYAENSGAWLEQNGFHEVEINRVTEQYGVIAHAFSTYESRRLATDPEPFARGINSFQLLNDGTRWWVVSIYWLGESPDHPIPAKYLPGGGR